AAAGGGVRRERERDSGEGDGVDVPRPDAAGACVLEIVAEVVVVVGVVDAREPHVGDRAPADVGQRHGDRDVLFLLVQLVRVVELELGAGPPDADAAAGRARDHRRVPEARFGLRDVPGQWTRPAAYHVALPHRADLDVLGALGRFELRHGAVGADTVGDERGPAARAEGVLALARLDAEVRSGVVRLLSQRAPGGQ